jgi:hypothetical protein
MNDPDTEYVEIVRELTAGMFGVVAPMRVPNDL